MWLVVWVIAGVLIAHHAPLHAQATPDSVVTDGDDRPWSQGVPLADRQAARELFLEGNRLFRVPLFARAAEQYIAALRTWKHPAFYFNLALAQLNLGQEVEARDNLAEAVRQGEEPLGVAEFREARKQLQDVERQLGQIELRCQTRGAEVTLDGVTRVTGARTYRGWVKAGPHEITAKSPGYLAEARRVTVQAGTVEKVEVSLITLSEAKDAGRRWVAWKPWAVVAAGAAIAGGGGVLHALSARNFTAYDNQVAQLPCAEGMSGCTKEQVGTTLSAQLRRATLEQQLAVGGYIAGGSLIAAGAVLVYLNRPRLHEQAPHPSAGRVAVVPTVSSDLLGFLVSASY